MSDVGRVPRGMAQLGSASALGAEGRRFESGYPDRQLRAARGATILRLWQRRTWLSTGLPRGQGLPGQSWPMPSPPRRRVPRARRAAVAARPGQRPRGVAHRRDLRAGGVSRDDIRSEVTAGRWTTAGTHTVVIGTGRPEGEGLWWRALWETGAGAVLDGVTALLAAGLTGFTSQTIDVALPMDNRRQAVSTASRCTGAATIGPHHGCRSAAVHARAGPRSERRSGPAPTAPPR